VTRSETTDPASFLHTLLPASELRKLARQTGFLKRVRKLDVLAFLSAVVFVLCGRGGQRIASMRRSYALATGVQLARSSFLDRFTPSFDRFVAGILGRLESRARRRRPKLRGLLSSFKDVVAVDATVVRVHKRLAGRWPGTRTTTAPAAIKVHTWVRALTGELLKHRVTGERRSDGKAFGIDWAWRGCLFLFDRGYPSSSMWWRIDRVDAYFLTRLPASHKPSVVGENRRHRGRARKLLGQGLHQAARTLKRSIIDVDCDFGAHIRAYKTRTGRNIRTRFRVVGLWNSERRSFDLYVTNLRPEQMPAEAIRDLYRLRWEVELHYRLGKAGLGLNDLHTTKNHVVTALVRAALVRASVGMQARRQAASTLPPGLWINTERWIRLWAQVLGVFAAAHALGRTGRRAFTWNALARLAADPNRKRRPNRYIWESGQWSTARQ